MLTLVERNVAHCLSQTRRLHNPLYFRNKTFHRRDRAVRGGLYKASRLNLSGLSPILAGKSIKPRFKLGTKAQKEICATG
jgi:hypothetical protein